MNQSEINKVLELHQKYLRGEAGGVRANLSLANLSNADLSRANLSDASLSRAILYGAKLSLANLSNANLSGAKLSLANLSNANLSGADLSGANLYEADLSYANLYNADLSRANLYGANLYGADLSVANLSGANLSGANLYGAKLSDVKKDFISRLLIAKNEAVGLYDSLMRGLIDGSSYAGECACFIGTIAKVRKEDYKKMTIELFPDSTSPTERFFMGIPKGDTPQNNQVSKIVSEWIEEFGKEHLMELPKYKLVSSKDFPEVF